MIKHKVLNITLKNSLYNKEKLINYRSIILEKFNIFYENYILVPSFNNINKYILYDNKKRKLLKIRL